MHRPLCFLIVTILLSTTCWAQPPSDDDSTADEKAYARVPKEIVFQNDSQWTDNRWQQTDVGPFLAGTIQTHDGLTLKGLAIRVGDPEQVSESKRATVCYDTARCRISAAWTGGFLSFDPRRFGVIRHPAADGNAFLSTPREAGWARNGSFETDKGNQITRLPDDWISYHGFFTHGDRVVLSYSVNATKVLESPWMVATDTQTGIIRSLEIAPSDQPLQMRLPDPPTVPTVVEATGDVRLESQGRVLTIAPHDDTVRVKLLLTRDTDSIATLQPLAGSIENLSEMTQTDRGRFGQTLTTVGSTTESGGPYVIDTLTLPFENPWNALLFTSGHDFFSDGTAAICTLHGDVWTVSGIDRDLKKLRWRRYATGLSQPLGLTIVDDRVHVINRTQLTRLEDRNGDGEADQYECFNNDNSTTPGSHDYVTCLDTDNNGNFYYIHARTGVIRVSRDGKTSTTVADGFRNPNGMGVGPDGTITAAPQQGQWTPQSSLIAVREGGYYGYGGPRTSAERPAGWDLPMCFIPHTMDNSGGAQVWVESDRWGPLNGHMLHLSYGQCKILLALAEKSNDGEIIQGGTIVFPTIPGDFESGIMRGRFRPQDGQLYLSGLRGWQTRAIRDGCFQRVRYTGGPLHLPIDVKTFSNGVQLTFTEPLDADTATDPDNFFVTQWNYLWSSAYGSPDFSVERPEEQGRDEVPVVSASLSEDGRSVFLEMPGRQPVHQMTIDYLLASNQGKKFRGQYAHTINVQPIRAFPESSIQRRQIEPLVAPDTVSRLQPGLAARLTSLQNNSSDNSEIDVRILRLAASRDLVSASPSPFLPAGPFEANVRGTIKIPLSGDYEFRLEGTGEAAFTIGENAVITLGDSQLSSASIRLRKGHNPIQISYTSPQSGVAQWKLWWKGYNFGWEPVPPDALFHDSVREDLRLAQRRREGRQLVAKHRCVQCHQTDLGTAPMLETALAAPDLGNSGERLHADWIARWLLDPSSIRSDPSMPALLSGGTHEPSAASQHAADIAAFLTQGSDEVTRRMDASQLDTSQFDPSQLEGEQLFETLGCITCHEFAAPISKPDASSNRMSLHYTSAKYRPGAIIDFLLEPDKHHQASQMPAFALTRDEAVALATYIRKQSHGSISSSDVGGDVERGETAFAKFGCRQCHGNGHQSPPQPSNRGWALDQLNAGCLAEDDSNRGQAPRFKWTKLQRDAIVSFVASDLDSLRKSHPAETSARLVQSLNCIACHDRDGVRSERPLIIAEEGSGRLPEVIPALTWLGEKFHPDWNRRLLLGELDEKPRPWLSARMPAFPAYAEALAAGLATEHDIDATSTADHRFDPELAAIGESLTLETGLDCRQCHAIGDLQPRGDEKTQIALGINFMMIRDRMRHDSYHRFMLDPPRYDINTKMIKLSENGITTNLKTVYDQDARKQFEAVWHYMQSLKP